MADSEEKSEKIQKIRNHLRFQPLRFVHILFSIILTLYGAGIFLITIIVRTELSCYLPFLDFYLDKPIIVLVVGSISLVALGCLGVISSAQNLYQGIVTFGVLLFGLFMFKFTMAAVLLATLSSAEKSIKETLEFHVNNYTEYENTIDYIQKNLLCCGINDFTDWNSTLGYIPGSCCSSDNACGFADVVNINETGCYEALKTLISFFTNYLIIILSVLVALQITAMVITFFLARGISDYRQRISPGSEIRDDQGNTGEPEIAPKVENPLPLKSILRREMRENQAKSTKNILRNASSPLSVEKKRDHQTSQLPLPRTTTAGNYFRNPVVYRDVPLKYDSNLPPRFTPTAPPLTRAHRKYPIGF